MSRVWGEDMNKPPLGIMPKKLWQEERLERLKECIERHTNAYYPINEEWVKEYNDLLAGLKVESSNSVR